MEERRKAERLQEENDVTIIVDSEENNLSQAKVRDIFIDNYIKDISQLGAGIKTNIRLPVDALIELEFTSNGLREKIKTLGKVRWVNVIIQDESYEAGIEFCGTPIDAIKKLEDYISWKLKDRLNKKNLSPVGPSDTKAIETKEQPPIQSGDVNTIKPKEQSSIKNKPLINIAIISLCTIILIVALLKIFDYIPEFNGLLFFNTNNKVTKNIDHDSVTKGSATLPAPPVAAPAPASVPEATPVPAPVPLPAVTQTPAPDKIQEATKKIKVIGNSDSKKYHLPGMKYYNAVKANHRVDFDSEEDAVKAGYHKALQ